MVSLAVEEGTDQLLAVVRDFAAERIRGRAAEAERAAATPAELFGELHRMGVAPAVAQEYGGQGIPEAAESLLLAERLGYGDPGAALELLMSHQLGALVSSAGTAPQRERYLRRIAEEPGLCATVLYYEGFGRGPSELTSTAEKDGQDWVLRGTKSTVVRAAEAELGVLIARTGDGELTGFVLEREQLAALRLVRDDAARGKLGLRAARTATVEFSGIRVPEHQRLAGEHPLALDRAVARFRLLVPAIALGTGTAALDYAHRYTTERIAFGKPVFANQGVSFPLADCATGLDGARLDLIALVAELDRLDDPAEIEWRTTQTVQRITRRALDTTRIGVNSLGGHGYLEDHPVERWYRAASTLSAIDFDPLAIDLDIA
ncbi:acyl-CoA dehydrogenase family protein [Sciscionella marina]|uniref:acyl-CoA dehydrogenase family protein n=1 Tax=Sciscionella marina TaxID=508770 RepID=UPI00037A3A50|nr:acyl-CoA dehydrogenase family protein [Sciscionella marina]